MRLQIEEKLGINAFDIYGLSEIMGPGGNPLFIIFSTLHHGIIDEKIFSILNA